MNDVELGRAGDDGSDSGNDRNDNGGSLIRSAADRGKDAAGPATDGAGGGDDEFIHALDPHVGVVERVKLAWEREKLLLRANAKQMAAVVLMQYVHSVFTNWVYKLHRPGARLRDLGFELLPESSGFVSVISEVLTFGTLFATLVFALSPFVFPRRRPLYSTLMFLRFLTVVSICLVFRCLSFITTVLPSPADHCQPGSADYDPPNTGEIFLRLDAFSGCGDLIFSSHTTYTLTSALAIWKYSNNRYYKYIMVVVVVCLAPFVIAGRKHYTVDLVVAYYTVPMVWALYDIKFPDVYPPALFDLLRQQAAQRRGSVV
eukprot:TRINITY_DN66132_c5_g5_i1.p1 TRINITY_DN66132_c5_g5~~TRINITY_DN66132_c5_g5_i1.p1  ORF type:complete len:316 (-),score=118.23 TRINITY_DN66132_c5_g5_i1:463-1410(-)